MGDNPTRRTLIGGAGLAAVVAVMPAAALTTSATIEQHWQDRCAAYREFEADPHVLDDDELAQAYWDRVDAAEIAILNSPDRSARAAELCVWIAWSHANANASHGIDTAVAQGDFAALTRVHRHLDWHEKMLFAAISNLRGEG